MLGKILIVDDEPNLLRLVEYALQIEGYQTVLATNGAEAMQKVQTEQPDLVILDLMLPEVSGLEICQRLRRRPETANLPIIMLSARAQVSDKIEGLAAGADEYIIKPVDSNEMVARVAALLERTHRLRQAQPTKKGKVLGFIGAKGGVGTTTVALNVAAALAQGQSAVIAAELRSYFGSFSLQLGQAMTENLGELFGLKPEQIDQQKLRRCLNNHPSGLQVLFGPQTVGQFKVIEPGQAEAIVKGLAAMADYTILDLPCYPTGANWAALRQCDFVTMVVEPEPGCVQSGQVMLELLTSWGVTGGSVGVVTVNRTALALTMKPTEIISHLGGQLFGVVPQAAEACLSAQKKGVPLVFYRPNDSASKHLTELAGRLAADKRIAMSI